jgi:MoaA/NifB/PqqE/SkfB family radical SAM enzyme
VTSPGTPGVESWLRKAKDRYGEIAAISPRMKGLRAYLNWARANAEMLFRTRRVDARPLKLTFDPVNICQLQCPLCPTGLRIHDRDPGHARLHLFEKLMEELGDYVFFLDLYNWGEPLLNVHLEEMIEMASRKNVTSYVSTNLSLKLSAERIDRLVASGLGELICSLDGATPETYATYRRQGNFELALSNMRRIVEAKRRLGVTRPAIVWRFYVFRFNEHEIERARALAADVGVDRFVLGSPFLDEGRYPIPDADRKAMGDWATTLPAFNRYAPAHPEFADPAATGARRSRCDWHYVSTAINPDGGVAPCCAVYERSNDFGVLGEGPSGTYMEVVNNEKFRSIRDRFAGRPGAPTGLVCETCPVPAIMDYGRILNRQILMFTFVELAEFLRRPLRALVRHRPSAAAAVQTRGAGR